jgi:hypothetical protein
LMVTAGIILRVGLSLWSSLRLIGLSVPIVTEASQSVDNVDRKQYSEQSMDLFSFGVPS